MYLPTMRDLSAIHLQEYSVRAEVWPNMSIPIGDKIDTILPNVMSLTFIRHAFVDHMI
jgi:hypothetical protein